MGVWSRIADDQSLADCLFHLQGQAISVVEGEIARRQYLPNRLAVDDTFDHHRILILVFERGGEGAGAFGIGEGAGLDSIKVAGRR